MKFQDTEDLDQVIAEEKRLVAQEHFLDAWEAGLLEGIDAEIIARELIEGALRQITNSQGSDAATALIAEIQERDIKGDFLKSRTMQ